MNRITRNAAMRLSGAPVRQHLVTNADVLAAASAGCGCKNGHARPSRDCGCSFCSTGFAMTKRATIQVPAYLADQCMSVREKPTDYYAVPRDGMFVHIAEAVSQGDADALSAVATGLVPSPVLAGPAGDQRFVPGFLVELATGTNTPPGSLTFNIDWIDATNNQVRNTGQFVIEQNSPGRTRLVVFTYVPADAGALNAYPRLAVIRNAFALLVIPPNTFGVAIPAQQVALFYPNASATLNVVTASQGVDITFRTLSANDAMWDEAINALASARAA